MLKKLLTVLLIALCSIFASADICDDINALANEWNDVANFVDECQEDEEFTESELNMLEKYVTGLAADTYALADALIDLGNQRETNLGTSMRKAMAKLADSESQDTIVRYLDDLVDILDKTTDYCDE